MKSAEIDNTVKKREKINVIQPVTVSLFVVFTFFIFGPLETYISNSTELWFKLADILPSVLLCAAIAFILLLAFGLILKGKIFRIYIAIVFGIGLGLYVQGNFMVFNYGVLDGQNINWSDYTVWGIINLSIWLACLVLPLIILRFKTELFNKLVSVLSFIFIGIQISTLVILLLTTNLNDSADIVLTKEGEFDLSKDKNVIVFILDKTDSEYLENCLEEYPEVKEILKDFIYFSDTLGAFPSTRAGLPHILTGIPYDNSVNYNDYLSKSWDKSIIINELQKEDFDTRIFTNSVYVNESVLGKVSNAYQKETEVSSTKDLTKLFYKLVSFKYMPHFIKPYFWMYTADFDEFKQVTRFSELYSVNDAKFYEDLMHNGINVSIDKSAYRVYHLRGSHEPFGLDENAKKVSSDQTTRTRQLRGCFEIIQEYIAQLRHMGIYDKTSIVILADHGGTGLYQCPILLVKPYSTTNDEFTISNAPVSFLEDLAPTLVSFISNETNDYGRTVFEIGEDENRQRKFYYYAWDDSWDKQYVPNIYEYMISGKAKNLKQQDLTGNIYTPKEVKSVQDYKQYKYKLGESILLYSKDFIDQAVIYGLSEPEGDFIWTLGDTTLMSFELNKKPAKNLQMDLYFKYLNGTNQRLILYANDQFIEEVTVSNSENMLSYVIPKEAVSGNKLVLKFIYPEAKQLSEEDVREGAFAFQSLLLKETSIAKINRFPLIDQNCIVDFTSMEADSKLRLVDWHGVETSGRWTGRNSEIVFSTEGSPEIVMKLIYNKPGDNGDTTIRFNGHDITQLSAGTEQIKEIIISKEMLDASGKQTISIITPMAYAPASKGLSEDTRELGVYLKRIEFTLQ